MIKIQNNIYTTNLNSVGLSQTSKGVLLKWNDKDNYYKSGSLHYGIFNKVQPIVECICSQIREKLGFNGVDYKLTSIESKGCEDFDAQNILCCVSENFLHEDEILVTFGRHYKSFKEKITYDHIINEFKEFEEEINQTLILDFIVNNIDRHFNNFGYIVNGKKRYCPIFDNGLSLYSDLNLEEIRNINKNKYMMKRFDKSKPFEKKHMSQIKLIKNLPKINLENDNEDFLNIIKSYEDNLGKERVNAMCNLVEERLNYVRKIYSNV